MKHCFFLTIGLFIVNMGLGQAADPATPASSTNGNAPTASPTTDSIPSVTLLDPVIVTATRTPEPASKSTSSITVIDRETMVTNQYQTVADALQQVPGLYIATPGTPGQVTGVFIRGTETRHTEVLIDGQRLPAGLSGDFDLTNLSLDNVDRIEVVRGPSSTLYGGSAIGGVINIITLDGRGLKKPEISVSQESGSFNTFRETVSARGSAGEFDYSASLSRLDSTFQRYNNDYKADHADTKVGYQINSDLYANMAVNYRVIEAQNPGSLTAPLLPTDSSDEEVWRIAPEINWQTNDIWNQKVTYTHSQQRSISLGNQLLSFNPNARTEVVSDEVDYQSDVRVFQPWLLTGGTTISDDRTTQIYDQGNDGITPAGEFYQNSQTNIGTYLQSQWDILSNWKWDQSVRLEHFSDYGDEVTWHSGTSYEVKESHTRFHASYGTAFTPPSAANFAYPPINPNLTPERSRGYEAGIDQALWHDQINLSATYFHNNINNYINYVLVDPAHFIFLPENADEVNTSGVELSGKWKVCQELSFSADYTYTDANDLTTGARLVRKPRQMADCDFIAHPIQAVTLTLGVSKIMQWQDYNSAGILAPAPDYYVARASVAWQINQNWDVFGRIENLTNNKYQEAVGYPALDQAFYGGVKFTY